MKAFAGDSANVTEKLKFVFGRIENILEKVENASYQLLTTLKKKPFENMVKNFDQQDNEEKLTTTLHEAPFSRKTS